MSVVVKTSIVKCQLWSKVQQSSVTKSLSGQKSVLWQYQLWSFQERDTKLERFLAKNQHTQRKSLNFENWSNGKMSRIGHHFKGQLISKGNFGVFNSSKKQT